MNKLIIIALMFSIIKLEASVIFILDKNITKGAINYDLSSVEPNVRYEESDNKKISEIDINYTPSLYTQYTTFTQNYITRESYTKEVKKFITNPNTGLEELVETKTVNYNIDIPKSRIVNVNLLSTTNPTTECDNWFPNENTVDFGEVFTQNRNCKEIIELNYEYKSENILLGTTKKIEENNTNESKNSEGTLLNIVSEKTYTGNNFGYRVFAGNGCSSSKSNNIFYLGRGAGGGCEVVLRDSSNKDIIYNFDKNKTTIIEYRVWTSNPIYISYLLTDGLGGYVVTRDYSKFFGSSNCSWSTAHCNLSVNQPRTTINSWNTPTNYKLIYSNGKLYIYINDNLIKKADISVTSGNKAIYAGVNTGTIAIEKISIKANYNL